MSEIVKEQNANLSGILLPPGCVDIHSLFNTDDSLTSLTRSLSNFIKSHYGCGKTFFFKQEKTTDGTDKDLTVMVVMNGEKCDFFNMHPLRKDFQLVYSLPRTINIPEQIKSSLSALQRLSYKPYVKKIKSTND